MTAASSPPFPQCASEKALPLPVDAYLAQLWEVIPKGPECPASCCRGRAQLPWPELPSDTGRCGASDPSLPNPAPSLFPVSVGETAAVGERMGVGEKQGEGGAENRSHILFSAAASSSLSRVGGGGLRGPAENPVMPNSRPLPFADPEESAGSCQPSRGWKPE